MAARATPPVPITGGVLVSSTAAEPGPGETAWNAATAYTKGQQAYLASNHTVYERSVAGTTPTSPDLDPTNWLEVGPTNRWKMFDLLQNTGTALASPLTVVLAPDERVDTIALRGVDADTVTISVTSGGVPVFSQVVDLRQRVVADWYAYFFTPFSFRSSVFIFGLPPMVDQEITVKIERAAGNVVCGSLVIGSSVYLGETLQGAETDALNFSKVERDEFGNTKFVARRSVPKARMTVVMTSENVNVVRKVRSDLNGSPALWSWLDDQTDPNFDAGFILGFFKSAPITLDAPGPGLATLALELEEV